MATIKLYDKNAYETIFEGCVLSCEEKVLKDGSADKGKQQADVTEEKVVYEVVLDRTLFFPEEGGQSPDKGVLGGANVLDVQIKDDIITHMLDKPLEVGSIVKGEIDRKHRFSNMQQHSGEHIFSGLVYKKYGFLNVGFHLSDQIVTMDFNGPLTAEQIEELEWEVNEAIVANVNIKTGYPPKDELAQMEYRSKKDIEGALRIVEIEGYDVCACCAPHVARTGEIGGFKIQNVQNYKGGVRISYLCGFRALTEARKKAKIISELSGILTTNQELLAENVCKLKEKQQNLQAELNQAKISLMEIKLEEIPVEQKDVLLFEEGLEGPIMREVVNRLMEKHDGICGIFVGDAKKRLAEDSKNGFSFIVGSKTADCRQIATKMRENLGAKGGGNASMIQGSVNAETEAIKECILKR